tara:strand:+ start:76 stop:396 length:321 start_codon:yes stop_codon:yes gene_type:complete
MKREEILDTAKKTIMGPRATDYGPADENFKRIAVGWNVIVDCALKRNGELTEQHVALMMDWLKTCRLVNNPLSEDGWVDKCGYSAIGGELTSIERFKKNVRLQNEG